MNISILTLFPDLYKSFLDTSLLKKAQENKILEFDLQSFFSFANPKERIDAPAFGHGAGMLIKPKIVEKAVNAQEDKFGKAFKIFFSPQGRELDQIFLKDLYSKIKDQEHLMLLASRYEGMDARVEDYYADEIISIGNFVTMGGDLPAMVFLEAFLRCVPGVVGKLSSVERDSFMGPFVDYASYAEPVEWKGLMVPDVLRSGNHALIEEWRLNDAAKKSVIYHFDWVRKYPLDEDTKLVAKRYIPNHYVALMHTDVLVGDNVPGNTSVTSIDIHDIARSGATYGIKNYYVVTPLIDQQKIVSKMLHFWKEGYGQEYNPQRFDAVKSVHLKGSFDSVTQEIRQIEGKDPIIIATSAKKHSFLEQEKNLIQQISYFDQSRVWSQDRPVLFLFGTGQGLMEELISKCDFILNPVEGFSKFNHLSVRSAVAVILDRWLGLNET
jgi:tRNA (guanine37-N1)-methyltransferase